MTDDPLPAALAARLPEAAQKLLRESRREKRLGLLATSLRVPEDAALALLAEATGLPSLQTPEVDPDALAAFPARLAHEYQVVPVRAPAGAPTTTLHLATAWPPDTGASRMRAIS